MPVSSESVAKHLHVLTMYPDRHVGGTGNLAANAYFAERTAAAGWDVTRHGFDCLEWAYGAARLKAGDERFEFQVGPYSPPARLSAPLRAACCVEELESEDVRGAIVLLHGDISAHQYMPKNFPFYNPESHQRVQRALEFYAPAALIAATGVDPEMVGSQYPFPLFEDGDLLVPSAYMTDADGERLLAHVGESASLEIESERIRAYGEQVVAVKPGTGAGRLVVSAHIDSRKDSPGALDNASGVTVLLCLAELLGDYAGGPAIELAPFNGEDYYAAPGQKVWLGVNDGRLGEISLGINIDDAGLKGWDTHVSFYGCADELKAAVLAAMADRPGFAEGPEWFQGDHAILAMNGVPAIAVASAGMYEFMAKYAHSERDVVELADAEKIAEIAQFVRDAVYVVGAGLGAEAGQSDPELVG